VVGAGLTIRRVGVAAALIDGANAVLAGFETDGGGLDPLASDDDPQPGGVIVTNGGALTLSDAVLLGSWAVGIELSAGSTARLDDVALHGVRAGGGPAPDGGFGSGVTVLDGSTLDAIDLTIDGTALYGLAASGVGSAVTVAGGAVSDDAPDPAQDSAGFGVVADLGATVDLVDVSIARTHLYAVIASGAGTTLVLTDVDATDTQPTAAFAVGGGLLVQEGATAVATRLAVTGSDTVGVLVDASTATFDGLTVVDTRRGPLQSTAVGVAAQAGAVLDATGLDVRRTAGPGLVVSDARVTCGGCALAANAFAGLVVADGGDVGFTGGSIDDTVSDATEGGGVGAYVASGPYRSALTLDGAALAGNLHAGVYVDGDGDVALTDVTVSGGPVTRAVYPTGTAVYAHGTTIAGLSIADSTIADSDGAGVFLDAASASLSGNRYRANAVDVVQQLCSAATPTPAGLDAEPTDAVELCPPLDRPVDGFVFSTVYDPVAL
ncbi:MAG: right-handed parallel beta-helix repeat-containing protein, partial [Myxococcota bacterium]